MRVGIYHTLPGEGRTSMERYARELAAALRGIADSDELIEEVQPRRPVGSLVGGGPLGPAAHYLDRYVAYQWRARRQGADVHHLVDPGYGHLGWSLDRSRTVVTFHDAVLLKLAAGDFSTGWRPRRTLAMFRNSLRAIRSMSRVITDSASSRDDILRFLDYDPGRVVVVPLGVTRQFQPGPGSGRPEAGRRPFHILHVGHTGFYKNIEGIIRALPLINRRLGEPVVFVKAGGAFTRDQLDLIGSVGVGAQIEHLGHIPDDRLPDVYAGADLLLMPSLHEGFGLPVLEAMACGIPVVASSRGSLPEVVGDAGLLVEPDDPAGMAEAVSRLLLDTALRERMVRRGLAWAAEFTWERTARSTLEVYRAVHGEAGGLDGHGEGGRS